MALTWEYLALQEMEILSNKAAFYPKYYSSYSGKLENMDNSGSNYKSWCSAQESTRYC